VGVSPKGSTRFKFCVEGFTKRFSDMGETMFGSSGAVEESKRESASRHQCQALRHLFSACKVRFGASGKRIQRLKEIIPYFFRNIATHQLLSFFIGM
jgi:hypothetical protein